MTGPSAPAHDQTGGASEGAIPAGDAPARPVKIALLQMRSSIDPAANLAELLRAVADAAAGGAAMLFTPEMSLLLDANRARSAPHIRTEADEPALAALKSACAEANIWLALGSLALAADEGAEDREADPRLHNRSILIDNCGQITARYDKIHLFDVDLETGESWRESKAYAPGVRIAAADTPIGLLGLTVCYDLRFPALFDALGRVPNGSGKRGCDAIAVPAAFTAPTGAAHWHVLLRARAIEASAFVIAAAQSGRHDDGRETYGHSLVVSPWGEILLDMGAEPGLGFAVIDPALTARARAAIPSLANRREIGADGAVLPLDAQAERAGGK